MAVQIQLRRDTAAAWTAANPTLAQGEVGLETDTQLHKVGDGSTAWNSLPYRGRFVAVQAGTQTATSGTAVLSNANGVSFGMSGSSAITASVDAIRSVFAGTTNSVGPALSFLDANNVSFGMTSGTVTAIASFPQRPAALSAGTAQATSGTIVFSNSNGVSFGVNGQTITASFSGGGGGGIAAAAGSQTATSGTVLLANSNGISFGMSNNSQITASYTVPSTAGLISAIRLSAGTASSNLTAFELVNGSGVSFGLDVGSKVTASVAAGATATGNLGGLAAGGSTATSGTVVLNNANGVSFGYNGQTITASVGAGATATGNFGAAAAGTQTATSGTVAWADSNGLSFGMSGSTRITGSHDGVRSISAGTTRATGGEVVFSNSNGVSFGVSGQTVTASFSGGGGGGLSAINLSAGTTSQNASAFVFGNAGNVAFGLNGSTITASAPGGGVTLSTFEPFPFVANTGTAVLGLSTNTSAPVGLFPVQVPVPVAAECMGIVVSMSFVTGGTSSFQQTGSLQWGLYSRPTGASSTQLQLMGSDSLSYAVTYNNSTISVSQVTSTNIGPVFSYGQTTSAGLNITSGYTGLKLLNLEMGSTLTAGQYWLGLMHWNSSSSFNSGIRMSLYGSAHTLSGLAPMGSFSSAYSTGTDVPGGLGGNMYLGLGSYSVAGLTSLPATVSMSQITQAGVNMVPYLRFSTRVTA